MAQSIKMLKAQTWQPELLPQHTHKGGLKELTTQSCLLTSTWQVQTQTHTHTQLINTYIKGFTDNEKSAKELMLQVLNILSITFKAKNKAKRRKSKMKRWGKH